MAGSTSSCDFGSLHAVALTCAAVVLLALPGGAQAQETPWTIQFLPVGLLYESYVAGEKESRLSGAVLFETGGATYLDGVLGGRLGLFRYGTEGPDSPQGWQLDVEGAAFPRVNLESTDLVAADFRFGVPLAHRRGPIAVKFGFYHISSHVGDELLEATPGFVRINYVRDSLLSGLAYHVRPDLVTYGEVGYAFYVSGGAAPWEVQLGTEYSPTIAWCTCGAPYLAVNGHLREEVDWGGSLNVIAGWEFHSPRSDRRLRLGVQYFNGESSQYSFFTNHEELIGLMIWFDY